MAKLEIQIVDNESSKINEPGKDGDRYRKDVARKLVRENPDDTSSNYQPTPGMNKATLTKMATSIAAEIKDNRTIMELLPDTKAIFTLMVSTIKSPNT